MTELRFVWHVDKARANLRKHGISFEEAKSAFHDEHGLLIDDPDHSSASDERFVLLGMTCLLRVLVIVHAYREGSAVIRIISARRAMPSERMRYARRGIDET